MTSKLTGEGDDADDDVPKNSIAIFGYVKALLCMGKQGTKSFARDFFNFVNIKNVFMSMLKSRCL